MQKASQFAAFLGEGQSISQQRPPTFIDAFAGCGGLSLGLMKAGWQGLFAIEKDSFAHETLRTNFLNGASPYQYNWPKWLPQEPITIDDLTMHHGEWLDQLKGKVDLLAGGPPCQGFSSAGRRDPFDPRNKLVDAYLGLVERLSPDMVLLENVRGITYDFSSDEENSTTNYSQKLIGTLSKDYYVFSKLLMASSLGVPQKRPRFFLFAMRKGVERPWPYDNPFDAVSAHKKNFFRARGLPLTPSAGAAISDLEVSRNGKIECDDSKGYEAIGYKEPKTAFQKLMRKGFDGQPSCTRLAKHREHIVDRFGIIIERCKAEGRLNTSISKELREEFGIKKQAIRVMDPRKSAPTITSMPDDLLHYKEPRTLTVRENARLQTFPDWFEFKGKYTTGGHLRRREVPRFTQVANAVPPLIAELLGECLLEYRADEATGTKDKVA